MNSFAGDLPRALARAEASSSLPRGQLEAHRRADARTPIRPTLTLWRGEVEGAERAKSQALGEQGGRDTSHSTSGSGGTGGRGQEEKEEVGAALAPVADGEFDERVFDDEAAGQEEPGRNAAAAAEGEEAVGAEEERGSAFVEHPPPPALHEGGRTRRRTRPFLATTFLCRTISTPTTTSITP